MRNRRGASLVGIVILAIILIVIVIILANIKKPKEENKNNTVMKEENKIYYLNQTDRTEKQIFPKVDMSDNFEKNHNEVNNTNKNVKQNIVDIEDTNTLIIQRK